MSLITKRAQLGQEVEAAEGTAETLVVADLVLVENPSFTAVTPPYDRNVVSSSLSPYASEPGARSAMLEFDMEMRGSGAAGTAPESGELLTACGFTETVVPATSVTYTPASSSIPSLTLGLYEDGLLYQIWGARGNVSMTLNQGGRGMLHFTFTGADYSVTDVALLSPTYHTTLPPPFINASLTISAYAAILGSLSIDMNNAVSLRQSANKASGYLSAVITGRRPIMTLDPEMNLVATEDWFGILRSGTEGALTLTLGGTAGNICTVTAPKVQYMEIANEEREGVRTLGLSCQLNRSSGDDELSIAWT